MEKENMRLSTNERGFSVGIDVAVGLSIYMIVLCVLYVMKVDVSFIINIKTIFLIIFGSYLIQPISLFIFKKSIGTAKYKIEIRNVDGSEASRLKFLLQIIIDLIVVGAFACLTFIVNEDFFSVIACAIFIVVLIVMNILSKKGDRTLSDHILGLAAFKK